MKKMFSEKVGTTFTFRQRDTRVSSFGARTFPFNFIKSNTSRLAEGLLFTGHPVVIIVGDEGGMGKNQNQIMVGSLKKATALHF